MVEFWFYAAHPKEMKWDFSACHEGTISLTMHCRIFTHVVRTVSRVASLLMVTRLCLAGDLQVAQDFL
jgi:hypothetical protein